MHDDHLRNLNKHLEFYIYRPAILTIGISIALVVMLLITMFTGLTSII